MPDRCPVAAFTIQDTNNFPVCFSDKINGVFCRSKISQKSGFFLKQYA